MTGNYAGKKCSLFKDGIQFTLLSSQWETYQKFDVDEMNSCRMAMHIIESNHGDKIKCGNTETCDRITVDVSEAGLL